MIITRTPFRVSFAGGGSDLASFYEKAPIGHEACVVSTSINKYMYITHLLMVILHRLNILKLRMLKMFVRLNIQL